MRILVTGGAGFIGSNFVHYWIKNHSKDEIVVLDKLTYAGNLENLTDLRDNPQFRFVKGDINDYLLVREVIEDCDIVLHLAAESHVDRSLSSPEAAREFWNTNVGGTKNILEAVSSLPLGRKPKKTIVMSTDEVWGHLELDSDHKFHPGLDLQPSQPYSQSKAYQQVVAHTYNRNRYPSVEYEHFFDTPTTVVINCVNVIGSYQFPEKFIPLSITNVLEGKPIRVYGEGINVREWIYTEDLCRGYETVISKGRIGSSDKDVPYVLRNAEGEIVAGPMKGAQYLFGSGQEISNIDLAKMILRKMGKEIVIVKEKEDLEGKATIHLVGDRPIHDLRYAIDFGETTKDLGWKPIYNLDRSLDATIAWYTAHPEWWKPLKEGKKTVYEWETSRVQRERG